MSQLSDKVNEFFHNYARAIRALDLEFLESAYAETFLFATQGGSQPVRRDDFLKVLPKRQEFFEMIGLISTVVQSLVETSLDNDYVMVKAHWSMQFEKAPTPPVINEIRATYVLHRRDHSLQIVFQLDHQDLLQSVRDLGLLPFSI